MPEVRFWGGEQQVNTTTSGDQDQVSVGALLDGGYVIAWRDSSDLVPAIRYQRYDAEGRKVGAEKLLPNMNAGTDQDLPDVAGLPNGGFMINARSTVSGTNHNSFTYLFDSASSNTATAVIESGGADASGASVLALEDSTRTVHAWTDNAGGTFDVKFSVRQPNGTTVFDKTANFPSTGDQGQIVMAQDSRFAEDIFYAYTTGTMGRTIKAAYYDTNTNFVDSENEQDLTIVSHTFGTPLVLHDALHTFTGGHILYTDPDTDILYLNTFNSLLTEGKGLIRVTHGAAGAARMIALRGGSVAVVYQSTSGNGTVSTYCNVYGRYAWIDGLSDENFTSIRVNTTTGTPNLFSGADLTELADGRLLITWNQGGSADDNSGMAVMSQIIDPRGGLVNGTDAAAAETLIGNDIFDDEMHGYAGSDTMKGLAGNDAIYGGDGNDTLSGGRGDDTVYAGNGADTAEGGSGDDLIVGDSGNDTLFGNSGEDELVGGTGGDRLTGGNHSDVLTGGAGSDRFTYNRLSEVGDQITDYSNSAGNNDQFNFARAVFLGSGAQLAAGAVAAANFITRAADNLAQDANDYFIYQTNTRQLWYDPTGNAAAGDQILIATLQAGAPVLGSADVVMI